MAPKIGPREAALRDAREQQANMPDIPPMFKIGDPACWRKAPVTPPKPARVAAIAAIPDKRIDTSDVPEAGKAFFQAAKLVSPERTLEQRAKEEGELAWRNWTPSPRERQRPQLRSLIKQARKRLKAEAASQPKQQKNTVAKKSKAKTTKAKVAKLAKPAKTKPVKAAKDGNGQSKKELIATMLKRSGGCTTAEVLAATGWPAVSMPGVAKAAGITLKKEKEKGQPTRYYAV